MLYGEINRQRLKIITEHVVADTIDYLEARFAFSADWDGLEKWVHFAKDGEVYDIRLTDDCIRKEDHLNLSAGIWKVYLHGNEFSGGKVIERITTNQAILKVEPTGALNGEPFPEMPASVTEQILARLDEVEQNGGGTGDGYSPEAKVERVEGGVRVTITDKDGTTSEVVQDGNPGVHVGGDTPPAGTRVWVNPNGKNAKIPQVDDTLTKPGYAADAAKVGEKIEQLSGDIDVKLDADKLPDAINTALTQAKESGEFKGDPGQPGKPGNDYVLTEADKTEIAEIAAGMVDVPEGGGGTSVEIDSTLTQAGKAADAKVVGDKLGEVSEAIANKRASNVWYGTTSTAPEIYYKEVTTTTGDFKLVKGARVGVKFLTNSINCSALIVDGTTRTPIFGANYENGTTGGDGGLLWSNGGQIQWFTYDGEYFVIDDAVRATAKNNLVGKVAVSDSVNSTGDTVASSAAVKAAYGKALEALAASGTSGIPLIGAVAGQIPQISAVDENGAPTQWTPVDLPSGGVVGGWEQLADITLEADAQYKTLCEDDLSEYTELYLYVLPINSTDATNKITANVSMYLSFLSGGTISANCGSYWHNGNRPNFIDVKILGNTSRTICIDGANDATSVTYRSTYMLAAKRNGLQMYTHGYKYFGSGSVFKVWGRKE